MKIDTKYPQLFCWIYYHILIKFIFLPPGYATVKFQTSSGGCSTEFGSRTSLYTDPSGNYDIVYHDSTCLQIDSEGTVSYIPRPDSNLEMHDPKQHMQYVIRHFDPILIETVDNEGNLFRVTNTGESIVTLKGELMEGAADGAVEPPNNEGWWNIEKGEGNRRKQRGYIAIKKILIYCMILINKILPIFSVCDNIGRITYYFCTKVYDFLLLLRCAK